jgi:hypothetical protein
VVSSNRSHPRFKSALRDPVRHALSNPPSREAAGIDDSSDKTAKLPSEDSGPRHGIFNIWFPMAIAGDPGGKRLPCKARTLKQAVDKNVDIDRSIDTDRPTHKCTPLKYQSIVSSANVQFAMANPCISDDQFHCPSPKSSSWSSASSTGHYLKAYRRAAPLHWRLILSNDFRRSRA